MEKQKKVLFCCTLLASIFLLRDVQMQDYIKLNLNDKANLLWDEGLFIDKYIDLSIITNLYYLHNFYVEVVLSNVNGRITEITPFKKGNRLEKYITQVDLKELI